MTEHKFKIGLLVQFYPKGRPDAARGTYQIIKRLPAAGNGEFQYEIRRLSRRARPRCKRKRANTGLAVR
jgi:hypothetical protein